MMPAPPPIESSRHVYAPRRLGAKQRREINQAYPRELG